jgi:hypothetical protein
MGRGARPAGTWRDYEGGPEALEILVIGAPKNGEAPRDDVEGRRDWWLTRTAPIDAIKRYPGAGGGDLMRGPDRIAVRQDLVPTFAALVAQSFLQRDRPRHADRG